MDWMKQCYSRLLIDNHITDLEPSYMRKFDPRNYVDMVKRSGVECSMVYACDHNGNCYYPTLAGHPHANLDGRDLFGETVALLRKERIVPIAYYTVVFHNHSAITHPEWRMRDAIGQEHFGRYWHSCPSAEGYVQFTLTQLTEIASYDVDGFFIDMTFWPKVCCCASCRTRYRKITGEELPEVIDWKNPVWVRYQRMREEWMAEFAQTITDHLKQLKPGASVTHQFSPVIAGWFLGQSAGIPAAADYASGDFYGDKYQHRLGTKIFTAFSRKMPYEFMSSRCVNLRDHTSSKSEEELFLHAGTTLANGGAYFFIDAINPDGSLNPDVYDMFGRIGRRLRPFTDCIRKHVPQLRSDCLLYFSMPSLVDSDLERLELRKFVEGGSNMDTRDNPVVAELTGASIVLNRMKIPYRIAVAPEQIRDCRVLIVNNCGYLSAQEVDAMREFVRAGGTLIATGLTSLFNLDGVSSGNFALSDVFGVRYTGGKTDRYNYLVTAEELISNDRPAACVMPTTARVISGLAATDFPYNDPIRYASIHSNPPGNTLAYAGITVNPFGNGTCVYIASSFLRQRQHSQQNFAERLLCEYLPERELTITGLPASTEATLLRSSTERALLVGLVDYPEEIPGPVVREQIGIRLRLPADFRVKTVRTVSDNRERSFAVEDGVLQCTVDHLHYLELVEITAE